MQNEEPDVTELCVTDFGTHIIGLKFIKPICNVQIDYFTHINDIVGMFPLLQIYLVYYEIELGNIYVADCFY